MTGVQTCALPIWLVGANGTGKSTLLKILAGLETLDYGSIVAAKGISAGYLPQEGLNLSGRSVFDECMSVFNEMMAMEEEMRALTARMADIDPASDEYAQVADRHHRIDHEFRSRDGYALESQVGTVLSGLGFHRDDWIRQTEEFSGGWQMRIALAKLLLQKPNLLLLDEPTNHLDLEARNWLEEYLHDYPFAFVLISHDRYFLDVTVNKTVEIWNKRVYFYSGNYDKYLEQKQQRKEQLEAAAKKLGLEVETVGVSSSGEVPDGALALCGRNIDVFTQLSDNLTGASFASIGQAARKSRIPLMAFAPGQVRHGAFMSLSRDFYDNGVASGRMAMRVVSGENPAQMPFEPVLKTWFTVNLTAAAQCGVTIPESLLKTADEVVR